MKCHPLRWIWGLIPILIFSYLASADIRGRIETDLTGRTQQALKDANLGWAKVTFEGRDGMLSGEASDESEPGRAIQLATNINGVRILDGQADLLKKAEPYTWQAALNDGRLKLTGYVPNETTHKGVITAAKAAFPKGEIEDKLELARGNPPVADWLEAVKFSLKNLASMRHGTVELTALQTAVHGEALTTSAFKQLTAIYNTGLPQALRLSSARITPPKVSPYEWAAKLDNNQLVLSGFVPTEQEQVDILTHAKRAFGKTAVVDKLELGAGAPENFAKAVRVSLDQLATLQQGSAAIRGDSVTLEGAALDEIVAEQTRKAFKGDAPSTFKVSESIRGLKTVAKPYTTRIEAGPTSIDLSGYVPSEPERAVLVGVVKHRFPGREIRDKLKIAGGEPAGYEPCVMAGLGGLVRLGNGHAELVDKTVEVVGRTEEEGLSRSLPGEVAGDAGSACETRVKVEYDDSAKRNERARREAERQADAQRSAAQAEVDAKRAAALAADQARQAASTCEGELRSAANSGTVTFETASDIIARQSRPTLKALAEIAKRCSNVLIEIEGHTDSEGVPERNQPLSERRAQAVADYLADNGVDAARIKAVGYGDTRPIAPNDTPENRAKNRRIDFAVKSQ